MTYVNDLDLILDYGDYNPEPNPTKKVNNAPNTSDEKKMSKIFLLADQLKAAIAIQQISKTHHTS